MAAPAYSIRIFSAGGLQAAAGTVGPVVPAGRVWVVRCIDALEITGVAPGQMEVLNPTLQPFWFCDRSSPQIGANFQWRGRQVFEVGEQIGFHVFSGTWSIMASGYDLSAA
jgi:hypothetical protein